MYKLILFILINFSIANTINQLPAGQYTGLMTQKIKFVKTYFWSGTITATVDDQGNIIVNIPQHSDQTGHLNLEESTITFKSFTRDVSYPEICIPVRPHYSSSDVQDLEIINCYYIDGTLEFSYSSIYQSLFTMDGTIRLISVPDTLS